MATPLQADNGSEQVETVGIVTLPTPGATVTIDLTTGAQLYKWTSGEAETVNASGTVKGGKNVTFQILNGPTTPRVITFGTGIKATGTLTGTADQTATITFRSDGTNLWELCRTVEIP
jgi:hypothetical protein